MAADRARWEPVVREAARRHGVPEELYVRQIDQESDFNPLAGSPAGAQGIAQIIPRFHPVDPWDPVASLDYAAKWMASLRNLYGSWRAALVSYNWGPGNYLRWDGQAATLPAETRRYLDVILGPGWPEPGNAPVPPTTPGEPAYCFPVQDYPRGTIPLHWGVSPNAADLFAPKGTPIRAMVNGRIDSAGFDSTGGWYVYLIGDADTKSLHYYQAHMLEKPPVADGQRVICGQTIGRVGDSGNAAGTGAHDHIGIGLSIKSGSGPEGGAGVPWPGNNCNKYLQHILNVLGSAPMQPGQPPPPPAETEAERLRRENDQLRRDLGGMGTAIDHYGDILTGDRLAAVERELAAIRADGKSIREQFRGVRP